MITSFFKPKVKLTTKEPILTTSVEENNNQGVGKRSRPVEVLSSDNNINDETATKKRGNNIILSTQIISTNAVQDLLQQLGDPTTSRESITWHKALHNYTSKPSFQSLANFVAAQREGAPLNGKGAIYPPPQEVFSALHLTPIDKVKVVIVGQDPYHQYNQGHGLAFSVKRGVKIPPSLRNIYKELANDIGDASMIPNHGCLERWAKQGVLLLNSVLTVRDSEPNSHANKGWEQFTDAVIRALDEYCDQNNTGLVFLLWGLPASKKADGALLRTRKGRHTIICTSHPSPLGATKTKAPFLGSRCFSRANEALIQMGVEPIMWNLDGLN